jgi:putative transposase
MPLRTTSFAPGEHYHICVRGNNKQDIFRNDYDRKRLLFLILHLQSPESILNIGREASKYWKNGMWNTDIDLISRIIKTRYVALEAFALMTNHLHLAVREVEELGIVRYMQRVLNAYAKYANAKYETVGHFFQGPYRAVHIEDNDQLLYLSTYIHRNPRELPGMVGKEHEYTWSSYQDYLDHNRFGKLLDPSLVLDQFESVHDYRAFVDLSTAKDETYLFDQF